MITVLETVLYYIYLWKQLIYNWLNSYWENQDCNNTPTQLVVEDDQLGANNQLAVDLSLALVPEKVVEVPQNNHEVLQKYEGTEETRSEDEDIEVVTAN
jgi:hypothetical protein